MKYFVITILAGLLFVGCSKKSGENASNQANSFNVDTAAIKTVPVSDPGQSFNIAYKFDKDKHYQYRISSFTHDEQTIQMDSSVTQKIDRNLTYIIDTYLTNEEKDGVKIMDFEIKSIKLDENVNGKQISFQSGSKMDSTDKIKFAEFYALLNNPFGIRLGSNGGVIEIFKVDKIVDKYVGVLNSKTPVTAIQKEQLKNRLTEGILKPMAAQVFREMPDKSLAKDSTWNKQQPPDQYLVFKINNSDVYKVDGIGTYNNDKLAVIDAGMKSDIEGQTDLVQNKISYHFQKPQTSTNGKIYFNLSKGCIQKSKVDTKLHFAYTMEGMTPQGKKKKSEKEVLSSSNIVELL